MNPPCAEIHAQGGSGPSLVLVHGFGADRYGWAATAPALTDAATVSAVDLPGHGAATDEVGAGDPATLATALLRSIAGLPGPAVIVGHSLGGTVALHLACRAPELVRRLVLIAPAGIGGTALDPAFLEGLPALTTRDEALALLERLVWRTRLVQPAMAAHVLANLDRPGRRNALKRIAGALSGHAAPAPPPAIPIDLVWGAADAVNPPPPDGPGFATATRLTLPEVGHLPQVEAAATVNRVIRAALTDPENTE